MTKAATNAWGDAGRYYAAEQAFHAKPLPPDKAAQRLAEALEKSSPGIRQAVERTVKQWNNILRDVLRSETALRLSVGSESQAVPVRVVAGVPLPFAEVMRELAGLEHLLLNRPAIMAAASGTGFMAEVAEKARQAWGAKAGPSGRDDIARVQQTAQAWLAELDRVQAIEKITGINEDVLGAYFFRIPEIRIYWVVIGITACALGISAEALTVVVLAHELAHAYTHLGRDIDSVRWETEQFALADLDIVEGLAQFYTAVLCRRLDERMPAAMAAYKRLLEKQSGPYRAHEAWVKNDEEGGEIMRVAMIECRSQGMTEAAKFAEAVARYRKAIPKRSRPQALFKTDEVGF
jgi:hypothetical protein